MISKSVISDVLNAALSTGGDFAEVFIEDKYSSNISMIDGKVENAISGKEYGIGIRIFSGTKGIYAYTNDSSRDNLIKTAAEAAAAISGKFFCTPERLIERPVSSINRINLYPQDVERKRKIDVMKIAHNAAASFDPLITQVKVNLIENDQNVLIANSEGLYTEDRRVRTRISIQSVASKNGEKQTGFYGPGRHMGFEMFDSLDLERYAREASRIAVTMINADPCPSGRMPVIISNEFGGVIFHEACGHSLEATSVARGNSVFTGKLGQKVASDIVTAIDDGTIPNAWGSQNIDDEGNPTRKNVLIENGILKGYMIDKLNGRRMGMEPTGNSRRESYKFAPTSRMTNTYIAPGSSTEKGLIEGTEHGLYARYMGGGSVNTATGDFNFAVMEGYIVKNGKIDRPVRGATLIGKGSEVLLKIDGVANNLGLGQGMCGSVSGSIPANVGQPAIRVSEILVGGTGNE
jgi:Predicted Zn-dependent proteases and their inactivated homologs